MPLDRQSDFGRCDGCGAPYLMDGPTTAYGYCRFPECEGDVKPVTLLWTSEQAEHYRLEMHRHAEEKAQALEALRETLDLCNSMREYAPTLSMEAEKRLRDSLSLLETRPDPTLHKMAVTAGRMRNGLAGSGASDAEGEARGRTSGSGPAENGGGAGASRHSTRDMPEPVEESELVWTEDAGWRWRVENERWD